MSNSGGSDGGFGVKLGQPGGAMVVGELGEWKRERRATYRAKEGTESGIKRRKSRGAISPAISGAVTV